RGAGGGERMGDWGGDKPGGDHNCVVVLHPPSPKSHHPCDHSLHRAAGGKRRGEALWSDRLLKARREPMQEVQVLNIQRLSAADRAKIEAVDPAARLTDAGGWFDGEYRDTWPAYTAARYLAAGANG